MTGVGMGGEGVSVPSLMAEAEATAGTDDWGDLSFLAAADLLLESCRSTGQLNDLGWRVLPKVFLRHLLNRLYLQAHLRRHPAAAEAPLRAAVVVTGLPRTGTTVLHNLLAQDPAHRVLRLWQALHPVPAAADGPFSEPALVGQARSWLEKLYEMTPAFRAIHPATPDGPEECDALFQNAFASHHFDDMFDAQDYSSWLHEASLEREYGYYALQLRVLAGADDGPAAPWALKSPSHLAHLPALLATLPDAVVVHCHRHVLEAVPSYASLVRAVRSPYRDHLDPAALGRQALERCSTIMAKALAARDAAGPDHFVDVSYDTLVADPIAAVGQVYDRLGRPLGGAAEGAMRRWVEENPQHRHGVHRYRLEEFGLDGPGVLAALSTYLERFPALMG
ncbi:MAG: sulfotransferase [Actinomycetota bacterium]|nr:sulfotransferase [Actinomycetota bacterium]